MSEVPKKPEIGSDKENSLREFGSIIKELAEIGSRYSRARLRQHFTPRLENMEAIQSERLHFQKVKPRLVEAVKGITPAEAKAVLMKQLHILTNARVFLMRLLRRPDKLKDLELSDLDSEEEEKK